jgi:4-hydroxythreonine-4-phosphate dehydrogenase
MINKPLIAITMGDPSGIGPEVIAKALNSSDIREKCEPLVIGNVDILATAFRMIGSNLRPQAVGAASGAPGLSQQGKIAVFDSHSEGSFANLESGVLSAAAGKASVEWVISAGQLAIERQVDAIATAPINKAAAKLAGYDDIGHMEILQTLCAAPEVATMLVTKGLRVVHLTTHRSLRVACDYVTKDNVLAKLRLTSEFFSEYGIPNALIGVAALNPHGGEEGLLGTEEIDSIVPAIIEAQREGINTVGPIPADSIFQQAINGKFDVVLAMYHDQGHIPIKVHGWEQSFTVNLGLPIIRTSVDHGTAFDIAGKGLADPKGMETAIKIAAGLAGEHKLVEI